MSGVALITGGQRGIGLGIARALKGAGFDLALVAEVEPQYADLVVKELGARYYQYDLQAVEDAPALIDRIESDMGPVTTLVSNAGVPARKRGDLLDVRPENYDFTMDINLKGAFFLAQAVARRMLGQPSDAYRSISFVTSVSAELVSIERAEYCISKAGASMMAKLFAVRLAEAGIGVFELRPGIIATDMTAETREARTPDIERGLVPARRWGEPQDIGQVIVPLATGQLAFGTGSVIPVDGGLSIHRL